MARAAPNRSPSACWPRCAPCCLPRIRPEDWNARGGCCTLMGAMDRIASTLLLLPLLACGGSVAQQPAAKTPAKPPAPPALQAPPPAPPPPPASDPALADRGTAEPLPQKV